ncbi:hypothetical protein CYY_005413 [Polysphondylium violaceum]|uniref:Uncharacterized protein n=1 Tax=Polysphondylium violaceum TaxID=133409 RepID=A0A8J4PWM7_9MYCE|nr:hypothetical protein CYY_005413 [Polysphondylium violaceum]
MNKEYYTAVFDNKYLSKKIFSIIHEIQKDRYSLNYDDIVDIGWMFRHGHIGLAREKIKNNNSNNTDRQQLYIDPKDLFTIVANTDTELFIHLFEQHKYSAVLYYELILSSKKHIKNVEVVKYLYEHGFARDVTKSFSLAEIDYEVLKYYLENGWLKPTLTMFITYAFYLNNGSKSARSDLKEIIALMIKYVDDKNELILRGTSRQAISLLLLSPIPGLIESLAPYLDQTLKDKTFNEGLTFQQALDTIKEREDFLVSANVDPNSPASQTIYHFKAKMAKLHLLPLNLLVGKRGDEFFTAWNALSGRIRVINNRIYYHTQKNFAKKMKDQNVPSCRDVEDITIHIADIAAINGCLRIIKFLYYDVGAPQPMHMTMEFNVYAHILYPALVKYTSKEDRAFILKLSSINILSQQTLLLACCAEDQYSFKDLCQDVDLLMDQIELDIHKIGFTFDLIQCAITHNDFVGFKHMMSKYIKLPAVYHLFYIQLAASNNLVFIDYIFKNRDKCFPRRIGNKKVNQFFIKMFENAYRCRNIALLEYLIQENCFDIDGMSPKQLVLFNSFIDPPLKSTLNDKHISFHMFVYLVDHNCFDNIKPFYKLLCRQPHYCEYLYRNQQNFANNQLSFQPLFDKIICKYIKTYDKWYYFRDMLGQLAKRYECKLNDSHYHHLVKFAQGLTLNDHVPNSLFLSPNYKIPPKPSRSFLN